MIAGILLGGAFKYFLIFTPKLGEDEPILTHSFQRGLVKPPISFDLFLVGVFFTDTTVNHHEKPTNLGECFLLELFFQLLSASKPPRYGGTDCQSLFGNVQTDGSDFRLGSCSSIAETGQLASRLGGLQELRVAEVNPREPWLFKNGVQPHEVEP